MKLIMTHGYMLSDTGNNVYVQNLCRALVHEGHEVHLLCQEPEPLSYDFVANFAVVDEDRIEKQSEQETPYPGRCFVYLPKIGDLLPVYVYDDYPGWQVKTFLELTNEEFSNYVGKNISAVRTVVKASGAEAAVTNHDVPGPLIARRALEGSDVSYTSIVHGSALQYVARKSDKYMQATREGLEGARRILALSSHSAGTITEDFPDLAEKISALPGGVDTHLFRPVPEAANERAAVVLKHRTAQQRRTPKLGNTCRATRDHRRQIRVGRAPLLGRPLAAAYPHGDDVEGCRDDPKDLPHPVLNDPALSGYTGAVGHGPSPS